MYHINKEITRNGENLTLKNTAKHYYKKFDILGASKQETRSGKNLCKLDDKTETSNGITSVITNGVVSVKGTATSTWFNLTTNQSFTLKAGTYTVSVNKTLTQFGIDFYDSSATVFSLAKNLTSAKFTLSSEKTITRFVGVVANGEVLNVDGLTFQIEEGSVATEYEQYGASPSIEYEAPIESVGDNTNEFDISQVNGFVNSSVDNKIITSSALTGNYQYVRFNFNEISLKATEKCEISMKMKIDSGTYSGIINSVQCFNGGTSIGDSTKLTNPAITNDYQNYKFTITPSENTTLNRLLVQLGQNASETIISIKDIKISKRETGAYSPYGQGSIEIYNCNENLFDGELELGNINATTGANQNDTNYTRFKNYMPIQANTEYTISYKVIQNNNLAVRYYDKDKKFIGSQFLGNITETKPQITFSILDENVRYIRMVNGYNNSLEQKFKIEYGNTATEYIEHQSQTKSLHTQQPFRAIGDVKDRFVKVDGVNYERHDIPRLVLDGTEAWQVAYASNTSEKYQSYELKLNDIESSWSSANTILCTHFKNVVGNVVYAKIGIGICSDMNNNLIICTDILTLDEFKSKLAELYEAGTPVIIDYVSTEPELIPCTPEQVEQLEEIEKEMYSYDEVTNIYSTDKISPYFDVIAYQRISEEFKTRLKEGKITRGYLKVLATDTLPEIIIDENNYLKDLKIEELRYVPEEGFIGGAVAKRVSGNFNNVDNSFDIQDREVEVYLGVELEDETTEYIKYGTYIVQRPEDDQVNDNTSFESLDYMVKFNQEYKDRITYPCTLKELLNDILDQAGVNSKTNTFANSDFIVENNQFEQGTTLRDIIKAIAQVAFNWARIDEDDNFVMDFEMNENIDEELGTDDYFGFKKTDNYGPVNVIVLRNSQVEGENVTIKDENLINSPKGYNLLPIEVVDTVINGVTVINNGDGSITLNGTASAYTSITIFANKEIKLKPDMYTVKKKEISGTYTTSSQFFELQDENNQKIMLFGGIVGNVRLSQEKTAVKGHIAFAGGTVFENYTFILSLTNSTNVEKPYQPYIPVGEVELVIADNPFAYTELKRKQLIEAGRRLFGLRYTPMAVDMLGLMYLNAKDRISVKNLNGEKYSTYLFDHTIDYTGIVLDSMESKAKTKTETKYQYISSLAQGLSNVEIKVDKANKKIESIVQTQEDVSEKVAKTVARIEVVYALSDSSTIEPTDGWSTTAPEWTAGKYMWQKTITTYANGTTAETAATNISGAKGEAGQNGIGITQTNITYQKSTSGTTVPTGTWQTTIPEVDENGYLWTRTEFIYSDGSKKYAYNVGKKGAAGIGVKSLVDQYYLSTSNTEQTGGEWTETQPEWEDNTYIWTRTKIVWTDNSITYTDPILANTLNNINSNIVVLQEFKSSQITTNTSITNSVSDVTRRLNNDYLTTEQVNSQIDGLDDKYEILEGRVTKTELSSEDFKISIETIKNQGVDKITTSMGYTFNDNGLNINRDNADTGTIVDEAGIQVVDKTGAGDPTDILYAGYVKEDNTKYADYAGQTIVATSNLIVKNFLVIGSNSRFQDYTNPILGGQGTGVYDI